VTPSGRYQFKELLPGEFIPEFSLRTVGGQRIRSAEFLGLRLVLAFTGLGGGRRARILLTELRSAYPALLREEAIVLAIAPVVADTKSFVDPGVAVPFPVLRDPAALVHHQFGAVDWGGKPAVSLFITDCSHRVIYRALTEQGETLPSGADIVHLLWFDQLICPVGVVPRPGT
jgi:peroxiredoxin